MFSESRARRGFTLYYDSQSNSKKIYQLSTECTQYFLENSQIWRKSAHEIYKHLSLGSKSARSHWMWRSWCLLFVLRLLQTCWANCWSHNKLLTCIWSITTTHNPSDSLRPVWEQNLPLWGLLYHCALQVRFSRPLTLKRFQLSTL